MLTLVLFMSKNKELGKKKKEKKNQGRADVVHGYCWMTTISFIQPYVQSFLYSTVDDSCIIVTRTSHV